MKPSLLATTTNLQNSVGQTKPTSGFALSLGPLTWGRWVFQLPESHIPSLLPRKPLFILWAPASKLLLHDLPQLPFPTLDHVPFLSVMGALLGASFLMTLVLLYCNCLGNYSSRSQWSPQEDSSSADGVDFCSHRAVCLELKAVKKLIIKWMRECMSDICILQHAWLWACCILSALLGFGLFLCWHDSVPCLFLIFMLPALVSHACAQPSLQRREGG